MSHRSGAGMPRHCRWIGVAVFVWIVGGIVVGELLDGPFDPVRVVVNLVLAALVAWFVAWLFRASDRG
jgi:surface polysaccharide O-acyltransferase-like enzyme